MRFEDLKFDEPAICEDCGRGVFYNGSYLNQRDYYNQEQLCFVEEFTIRCGACENLLLGNVEDLLNEFDDEFWMNVEETLRDCAVEGLEDE